MDYFTFINYQMTRISLAHYLMLFSIWLEAQRGPCLYNDENATIKQPRGLESVTEQ